MMSRLHQKIYSELARFKKHSVSEYFESDLQKSNKIAGLKQVMICIYSLYKESFYTNPVEYLKIIVKQNDIKFLHINNKQVVERYVYCLSSSTREPLQNFMKGKSSLPLHILLDTDTLEFKSLSLENTHIWHRKYIVQKFLKTEFDAQSWIYNHAYHSKMDKYKHIFVDFKPSAAMMQSLMILKQQTNPILSIQIHSLQCMQAAIARISPEEVAHFAPWIIFMRVSSDNSWMLVVQNDGIPKFSRNGNFQDIDYCEESYESQLRKELLLSLRYLQRYGYTEGDSITLIISGFKDIDNIVKETLQFCVFNQLLNIPSQDIDTQSHLDRAFIPYIFLKFLKDAPLWTPDLIESFKNKINPHARCFQPVFFKTQLLPRRLPIMCFRIIAPLTLCLALSCLVLCVNFVRDQQKIDDLITTITVMKERLGTPQRQAEAQLFDVFTDYKVVDPNDVMKYIKRIIGRGARLSDIKWHVVPKSDRTLAKQTCEFEATLKLPKRLIMNRRKLVPDTLRERYLLLIRQHLEQRFQAQVKFDKMDDEEGIKQKAMDKQNNPPLLMRYKMTVVWSQ